MGTGIGIQQIFNTHNRCNNFNNRLQQQEDFRVQVKNARVRRDINSRKNQWIDTS